MVVNIQVLRNFAAMAVVWHHLQAMLGTYLGAHVDTHWGVAGVDVFFVISGFIMFYTTREFRRSAGGFWLDRLIRIVPLYWLATWGLAALFFAGFEIQGVKALDAGDIGSAMVFWPDIRADGYPSPPLTVGWTLAYEMFFYLLLGLTFFMKSQVKSLVILTALFLALWAALRLTGLDYRANPALYPAWLVMQPITLEFAAGGLLAILYARVGRPSQLVAVPLGYALLLAGGAGIWWASMLYGSALEVGGELRMLTLGPPAVAVVAGVLLLEASGHAWRSRFLVLLGGASFALYLAHPVLLQAMVKLASSVIDARGPEVAIAVGAGAFVITTAAAVCVHLWIETPIQKALKSLTRRRAPAASIDAPAA